MRMPIEVSDPGKLSLRRASRTTVVACAVFFVGRYVLGNEQFSVFATFGAIALCGMADFTGSLKGRAAANAAATLAGVGLVAIGTAVSRDTAEASAVMFVVVFITCFSGIFSGYFAAGTNAVILYYLVASGLPASGSVIPARVEGVLAAGTLATVASVTLWPSRPRRDSALRLADSLEVLATLIGALRGSSEQPTRRIADDLRASIERSRVTVLETRAQSAPTSIGRALVYLMHETDRLEDLARRASELGVGPLDTQLEEICDPFLAEVSRIVSLCAGALRGGPAPPLDEALEARRTLRASTTPLLEGLLSGGRAPDRFASQQDGIFLLDGLAGTAVTLVAHTRVAVSADRRLDARVAPWHSSFAWQRLGPGELAKWTRRGRANLSLDSVHIRNSLRIAAGLSVARAVVGLLGLQHGFWVAFATLTVLRSSATSTAATTVEAVAGTLAGFGLSVVAAVTFGGSGIAYSLTLPVVLFLAIYLAVVSLVAGQALFTIVIVVLFNLLQPQGWSIGLLRVEDVVVGAAVGLMIGVAIWPRGAGGQLGRSCGTLIQASDDYAASRARSLLPGERAGPIDALRVSALEAAARAEDVFAQYLTERRRKSAPLHSWSRLLVGGNRLWLSADAMHPQDPPVSVAGPCAGFATALGRSLDVLADSYSRLAASLNSDAPGPAPPGLLPGPSPQLGPRSLECCRAMSGVTDEALLRQTVLLFHARSWLSELSDDLYAMNGVLEQSVRLPAPQLPGRWRSVHASDADSRP